jgi:hypothetical protein
MAAVSGKLLPRKIATPQRHIANVSDVLIQQCGAHITKVVPDSPNYPNNPDS